MKKLNNGLTVRVEDIEQAMTLTKDIRKRVATKAIETNESDEHINHSVYKTPINCHDTACLIAGKMLKDNLSSIFVQKALLLAFELEGVYDLMVLWNEELDEDEKKIIITDIEHHIHDMEFNS